jgi:hypothetical protein
MQGGGPVTLIERKVSSPSKRVFLIRLLPFQNGWFISVSEGSDRIGPLHVSIASSNKVNTARVIPSKYDSIFINTISETVSSRTNGISIVCVHSLEQLRLDDMKAIMGEIMNLVGRHDERNNQIQKEDLRR